MKMIMKHMMPWMIGTVTLCAAATLALGADETLPGQVDFGTFPPPKGDGEFVEVNVPTGLITLAARLVEKEQPEVAKLLNSLKLVRVNVIGLDAENRAALQKRAQKIREDLAGKGWERIVTAQEKDQDVSVYLKMTDKGAVQGLAAVVMDGKEHAVFANVVGDIKPEQLAMLGDKLHIDPLKQIGNAAQKPENKPKEKAEE
jgi:arginine repressor